jgi:head-tail adaptor
VTNATGQDSTGGFDLNNVVVFATVWATVEALNGMEQFATESQVSKVTHQIVLRYIRQAPSWQPDTQYLTGALVIDSNGNLQQAQAGGLSGALLPGPTWATGLYAYTSDGDPSLGLSWQNKGVASNETGVNASMQVVWGTRKFQITAVLNPDGRNKMLVLLADEINDSTQQNPLIGGVTGGVGGTVLDGGSF